MRRRVGDKGVFIIHFSTNIYSVVAGNKKWTSSLHWAYNLDGETDVLNKPSKSRLPRRSAVEVTPNCSLVRWLWRVPRRGTGFLMSKDEKKNSSWANGVG